MSETGGACARARLARRGRFNPSNRTPLAQRTHLSCLRGTRSGLQPWWPKCKPLRKHTVQPGALCTSCRIRQLQAAVHTNGAQAAAEADGVRQLGPSSRWNAGNAGERPRATGWGRIYPIVYCAACATIYSLAPLSPRALAHTHTLQWHIDWMPRYATLGPATPCTPPAPCHTHAPTSSTLCLAPLTASA